MSTMCLNVICSKKYNLLKVSAIDLTDDSFNESITCNNDEVSYVWNKTTNNKSIEAHSIESSNVKDNSTITFEQPNENDYVL